MKTDEDCHHFQIVSPPSHAVLKALSPRDKATRARSSTPLLSKPAKRQTMPRHSAQYFRLWGKIFSREIIGVSKV
jgi:hypothetical protein